MNQTFPSKLLERAVDSFATLPGIGRKTALRLVLHMLKQDEENVNYFASSLTDLRKNVKHCRMCHNICDNDICDICANDMRDHSIICVVQNIQDVMAIENTQQYHGIYHVLGGIISPIDGIGPNDLNINSLIERAQEGHIQEIILALSPTAEGETTSFFISRKLQPFGIKLSTIARGVSVGEELEYTDEITLGRSIVNRIEFKNKEL